jgi:hypothetical protein
MNPFSAISDFLGKILDRFVPDRSKVNEAQSRINEAEAAGGGQSVLRHWRGFLGWVLSIVFVWEAVGRTVISTYWPDVALPPSMMKEIMALLIGMLGLS